MRLRLQRLSTAQRIVVVVALAAVLRTVGSYIVSVVVAPRGGWFRYAPLTREVTPAVPVRPFASTVVWLVCTAVWALASVWLLGLPTDDPPDE